MRWMLSTQMPMHSRRHAMWQPMQIHSKTSSPYCRADQYRPFSVRCSISRGSCIDSDRDTDPMVFAIFDSLSSDRHRWRPGSTRWKQTPFCRCANDTKTSLNERFRTNWIKRVQRGTYISQSHQQFPETFDIL